MNENNDCCPQFNPEKWDTKIDNWDKKLFIKTSVPTLFHIPFPPMIGRSISKLWAMAEKANANLPNKEDALVLFSDPTPFKSLIYLSVTHEVPEAEMVDLSGTFVSKVYDGPYNAIPKFIKQMNEYLSTLDKKARNYYIHYAYCPKCAKKFGHNYALLLAEV